MALNLRKLAFVSLFGLCSLFPNYGDSFEFLSKSNERVLVYNSSIIDSVNNTLGKDSIERVLAYDTKESFDEIEKLCLNYYRPRKIIVCDPIYNDLRKFGHATKVSDYSTDTYFSFQKNSSSILSFSYENKGDKSVYLEEKFGSNRVLPKDFAYTEDRNNTHLYLILPNEVKVKNLEQKLIIIDNENILGKVVEAIPVEESKLYLLAKGLNSFLEEFNYSENSNQNKLSLEDFERRYFNKLSSNNPFVSLVRKIPGKVGEILDIGVFLGKALYEFGESQRQKTISETFGEDYSLYKIPFYSSENKLNSFIVGRKLRWELDLDDVKWYKQGYLAAPLITFNRQGKTLKQTSLKDLFFEFDLNPFGD